MIILLGAMVGYIKFLTAQCRDWLKNVVDFLVFRSKAPVWSNRRGIIQTLTQEYEGREGDVTIMPWAGHISPLTALMSAIKNPTPEEFFDVLHAAEANTWPAISRIKAHCLIEMTLDKCVQRLRKRITEESEQRAVEIADAIDQGANPRAKAKMDRTPSFYTSRSIVNLSGLSVADPLPTPVRRPSGSSHNKLYHSVPTTLPGHTVKPSSRDDLLHVQQPAYDPHAQDDDLHLYDANSEFFSVKAGEVPLGQSTSKTDFYQNSNNNSNQEIERTLSNDNTEERVIHKYVNFLRNTSFLHGYSSYFSFYFRTTHMANFYYKKGHSHDNLAALSNVFR